MSIQIAIFIMHISHSLMSVYNVYTSIAGHRCECEYVSLEKEPNLPNFEVL